jgi:phage terminase large subunit
VISPAVAAGVRRWKEDPVQFVHDLWPDVVIDPFQETVLRAFPSQDPKKMRIAIQACVGVGKGAVMAWCGWNFLLCYCTTPGKHPNGAVVAPTEKMLRDNIWKEYAVWWRQSPVLSKIFDITTERIFARDHPETWWLSARTYPKDPDNNTLGRTLSGLHSENMLIQIDESATVPPAILDAAEQARSSTSWFKVMQAGNPISLLGSLYEAATKRRERWMVVEVTGDPDDPKRCTRIPLDMAMEAIADKGRDDPWVMAHILGKFPPGGINTLITPDDVELAMNRAPRIDEFDFAPRILGIDVAREGLDRSVIFRRQGRMVYAPDVMRGVMGREGSQRAANHWNSWRADACFIDNTGGFGGSWLDHLKDMGHTPIPIHFAAAPFDPRFLNKRAEMWFALATWIKEGGALPRIPDLANELTAVTYAHKGDKLKLEDKDAIKKRLGFSPDLADALALTFASPVAVARGPLWERENKSHVIAEYDPYALS